MRITSDKEKKRRSIAMRKLNLEHRLTRVCLHCKQEFTASLTQKLCSSKCSRERYMLMRYGLTADDFSTLTAKHNGRCAICDKEKKLVIDHCHKTGRVRGLLCRVCNMLLHYIDDDIINERIKKYVSS